MTDDEFIYVEDARGRAVELARASLAIETLPDDINQVFACFADEYRSGRLGIRLPWTTDEINHPQTDTAHEQYVWTADTLGDVGADATVFLRHRNYEDPRL